MKRWLKLLLPGYKFKRWILVVLLAVFSLGAGLQILFSIVAKKVNENLEVYLNRLTAAGGAAPLGLFLTILGLGAIFYGGHKLLVSLKLTLMPDPSHRLSDLFLQKREKSRGPKIVAIGGGSGLSVLLRGLKQYTENLTAVVTVADDGGSSGILRKEMGVLPPGDIRNCILAMANTEPSLQRLFNYRFKEGSLKGHNFGNLFLTAMAEVSDGSFEKAIQETGKVLAMVGQVYPATLEKVTLMAETEAGYIIEGESKIGLNEAPIKRLFLEPGDAKALPEVLQAIEEADAVVLGPGSLYTSILPNLLIEDITKSLNKTPALVLYVVNVMCQPGETLHFKASDHVKTLTEYLPKNALDYVLLNSGTISPEWLEPYSLEGAEPVINDGEEIVSMGFNLMINDYLKRTDYIRHDEEVLAKDIIELVLAKKYTLEERRHLAAVMKNEGYIRKSKS